MNGFNENAALKIPIKIKKERLFKRVALNLCLLLFKDYLDDSVTSSL